LEKGESDDRIIQNKFDLLIVEVVEERGETTFCDHVALCAIGFCMNQHQSRV
jgi:hypothetical protein